MFYLVLTGCLKASKTLCFSWICHFNPSYTYTAYPHQPPRPLDPSSPLDVLVEPLAALHVVGQGLAALAAPFWASRWQGFCEVDWEI